MASQKLGAAMTNGQAGGLTATKLSPGEAGYLFVIIMVVVVMVVVVVLMKATIIFWLWWGIERRHSWPSWSWLSWSSWSGWWVETYWSTTSREVFEASHNFYPLCLKKGRGGDDHWIFFPKIPVPFLCPAKNFTTSQNRDLIKFSFFKSSSKSTNTPASLW